MVRVHIDLTINVDDQGQQTIQSKAVATENGQMRMITDPAEMVAILSSLVTDFVTGVAAANHQASKSPIVVPNIPMKDIRA